MSIVKVRAGESIEKALRVLKKKLDKEGVLKHFKTKAYYDKPSVRKRAKEKASKQKKSFPR